jgi:hypothetical protein
MSFQGALPAFKITTQMKNPKGNFPKIASWLSAKTRLHIDPLIAAKTFESIRKLRPVYDYYSCSSSLRMTS